MRPVQLVALLLLGWLAVQFFPWLGRGWPGLIGGCIGVWVLYLLLSHSPDIKGEGWGSRSDHERDYLRPSECARRIDCQLEER